MKTPMNARMKTLLTASGVAALTVAAAALTSAAAAFPDSRIEAQLRPDFGLLLHPPVHHHYRPWGGHGWWAPPPPPPGRFWSGDRNVAVVDCSTAPPDAAQWALDSLVPGGTLILHTQNDRACVGGLVIHKPVTIQGDARLSYSDIRPEDINAPATLKAVPGRPCIAISVGSIVGRNNARDPGFNSDDPVPNARPTDSSVVLRALVLDGGEGGPDSCIFAENSNVRIERSVVRYAGERAAVYLAGGSLSTRDRVYFSTGDQGIDNNRGRIPQAVIQTEDARLDLQEAVLIGGPIGIDADGTLEGQIRNSEIVLPTRQKEPAAFGDSTAGISLHGRSPGRLTVENSSICGFGIGAYVAGANLLTMDGNTICRAGKGIYAAGGAVTATNNAIMATNVGIQLGAGSAERIGIVGNQIYGPYEFILAEPGANTAGIHDNLFFASRPLVRSGFKPDRPRRENHSCEWRPVDDRYFGGSRRPWGREWKRWYYMSDWRKPMGYCADPADFRGGDPYETQFFPDSFDYGVEPWGCEEDFVGGPYDSYDWQNPWWRDRRRTSVDLAIGIGLHFTSRHANDTSPTGPGSCQTR